jgi:hypothetical protein
MISTLGAIKHLLINNKMKAKLLKKARRDITIHEEGKGSSLVYVVNFFVFGMDPNFETFEIEFKDLNKALSFRRDKILSRARHLANNTITYCVHRKKLKTFINQ